MDAKINKLFYTYINIAQLFLFLQTNNCVSFPSFVIQTTVGRKNLEIIHVIVPEILRFALNDNYSTKR